MQEVKIIFEDVIATIINGLPISVFIVTVVHISIARFYSSSRLKILNKIKSRIFFYFFVAYVIEVLLKTVFFRDYIVDPLENVIGIWDAYRWGAPRPESLENIIMFIPLMPLVWGAFNDNIVAPKGYIGGLLSFVVSLCIEILQLVFHRGTFQCSDLL